MKKFLAVICTVALLISGCGNDQNRNSHSNEQFKVGTDIPAGEYLAVVRNDFKGWQGFTIRNSAEHNADNIIINEPFIRNQRYIELYDGEYIDVFGIKLYPSENAPKIDTNEKLVAAQYKAGTDIPAGEYKIVLNKNGYFAIATSSRHDIKNPSENIVRNAFAKNGGEFSVTVSEGQYLLIDEGEGYLIKATEQNNLPDESVTPSQILNLGMTFDQFKENFAVSAKNFGLSNLNVNSSKRENGDVQDIFLWKITGTLGIQGAIDKSNGLLKEVGLISSPQTAEEMMNTLLVYEIIISVMNPELNHDERAKLISKLKLTNDGIEELSQGNAEAVRGNVRYTTILIAEGVFQLIASAKDL